MEPASLREALRLEAEQLVRQLAPTRRPLAAATADRTTSERAARR